MKDKIKIIIFIVILGAFSAGALTSLNHYTKQRIELNNEIKRMSSVLEAFRFEFEENDIMTFFEENIIVINVGDYTYFETEASEVAFEFNGNGLWGPISGIIALKPDIETIKGITIIRQDETPGLGGEIANKDYLENFTDKKIVPRITIIPAGTGLSLENEVDAITGATLTSKAFEELLNTDILKFKEIYEN